VRRKADDSPASSDVVFNKANGGGGRGGVSAGSVRMEVVFPLLDELTWRCLLRKLSQWRT
jgi:hypothetical protein